MQYPQSYLQAQFETVVSAIDALRGALPGMDVILTGSWPSGTATELSTDVDITIVVETEQDLCAALSAVLITCPDFWLKKTMEQGGTTVPKLNGIVRGIVGPIEADMVITTKGARAACQAEGYGINAAEHLTEEQLAVYRAQKALLAAYGAAYYELKESMRLALKALA